MTYNIILGIDIGLSGALAVFDTESKELISIYDMPTKKLLSSGKEKNVIDIDRLFFLLEIPRIHKDKAFVIFEDVHAFPGQGVVSVATLAEQKGIIRGMITSLDYSGLAIQPKEWQKHFGIIPPKDLKGKNGKATKRLRKEWLKQTSRETATKLFPRFDHWFEAKTSHGRSDATLIGQYALSLGIE